MSWLPRPSPEAAWEPLAPGCPGRIPTAEGKATFYSSCSQPKADCASYHRSLASCTTVPHLEATQDTQAGGFSQAFGERVCDKILPPVDPTGPLKEVSLGHRALQQAGQISVQLSPATVPSVFCCCLYLSFPFHKSATYLHHNWLLSTAPKHVSVGILLFRKLHIFHFYRVRPC